MSKFLLIPLALCLTATSPALAQYNPAAAVSAPTERAVVEEVGKDGVKRKVEVERRPAADAFGNAAGNQFDLAIDGAFEGQTIAVIHLYTGEGFDFSLPKAALKEKGFSVYRWVGAPPSPKELKEALKKSCQLWIISGSTQTLNEEHLAVIKAFFEAGHGLYIWGDNEPYYADANFVARALLDTTMNGNIIGDQVVGLRATGQKPGVLPNHLLSTGLEHLYEGITIATLEKNGALQPLVYGSAGNLVTAFYDRNGRRALLDGGFTRLFVKWDTAGTGRYVKNAAAWLANVERFGEQVTAAGLPKGR